MSQQYYFHTQTLQCKDDGISGQADKCVSHVAFERRRDDNHQLIVLSYSKPVVNFLSGIGRLSFGCRTVLTTGTERKLTLHGNWINSRRNGKSNFRDSICTRGRARNPLIRRVVEQLIVIGAREGDAMYTRLIQQHAMLPGNSVSSNLHRNV
ncbi:hypothetical protein G5I_01603 [Acromyrmex echinatior]|uniref:Uncharacterized protein n=1 Tax=Acromyrmex echinatior TaxID=103372 RepID=F4W826_ACREC|nr:hypothetical protein G5I_01603 [Acromyrmex echinatior]